MSESTGAGGPDAGTRAPHHGPGPLAAIAVGGALGTIARYGLDRAIVTPTPGFPWATLTVNVVGSFVLGVVMTLVPRRWPGGRLLRPLLAVGFCGGFTTFSTFAVEIDQRVRHGYAGVAIVYLAVSLVTGLGAAAGGVALAGGRAVGLGGTAPPDPDLLDGDRSDGSDRNGTS